MKQKQKTISLAEHKRILREVIDGLLGSIDDFMCADSLGNTYLDDEGIDEKEKELYKEHNLLQQEDERK